MRAIIPVGRARAARFWLVTLASVLGLSATLALGVWQMGRAGQKLALQAAIEQRMAMPALGQQALPAGAGGELLHRRVVLRGTWVERHTVFLDNRQMHGKAGFHVVTALQLEGARTAILVERGWAPRNFLDRQQLPPVQTPSGVVEVSGRIAPLPGKLYELGDAGAGPIRQNLDLVQFRAETGLALLDLSVQQLGAPSEGLLRDWAPPSSGVEKNYAYAFQWWALSALIVILYVWFQLIAPRRQATHA